MSAFLNHIMILFNKYSERQRMVFTLLLAALIFLIWLVCFMIPLSHKMHEINSRLSYVKENLTDVSAIYNEYQLIIQSPTLDAEMKIKALEEKLVKLQHHPLLAKKIIDTPADMKNLLQAISQTGSMLSLNQVQRLMAMPILSDNSNGLLNQKISVEFDGGYAETIRYLSYLENLPWYLSFDSLDYQVSEYPNAKIKIVINALSSGALNH